MLRSVVLSVLMLFTVSLMGENDAHSSIPDPSAQSSSSKSLFKKKASRQRARKDLIGRTPDRFLPDLAPAWCAKTPAQKGKWAGMWIEPNSSYINDFDNSWAKDTNTDRFLNPKRLKFEAKRQREYVNLVRYYEQRQAPGTSDPFYEREKIEKLSKLSREIVDSMRDDQMSLGVVRTRNAALNSETLEPARAPIALALTAAAVYSGQPVKMSLPASMGLMAKTKIDERSGQVELTSKLVNTSFDYSGGADGTIDPLSVLHVDPSKRKERYRFEVSKKVPYINVSTGFTYGTSSSILSTSLSKKLTSNLTCRLFSNRAVGAGMGGVSDETVKLEYEMRF